MHDREANAIGRSLVFQSNGSTTRPHDTQLFEQSSTKNRSSYPQLKTTCLTEGVVVVPPASRTPRPSYSAARAQGAPVARRTRNALRYGRGVRWTKRCVEGASRTVGRRRSGCVAPCHWTRTCGRRDHRLSVRMRESGSALRKEASWDHWVHTLQRQGRTVACMILLS